MVDILVLLTSLDQLLLILKIFMYFTKQVTLTRRSTVLGLPLQLVFPVLSVGFRFFRFQKAFKLSEAGVEMLTLKGNHFVLVNRCPCYNHFTSVVYSLSKYDSSF